MSRTDSAPEKTQAETKLKPELEQALAALAKYDRGSSRSALLALDDAVAESNGNPAAKRELEKRLITVLSCGSEVARDYACVKLALIGSEPSIPALVSLLSNPHLASSARTVLESMPSGKASKALRDGLPKLEGPAKIGVITSLGNRRDAASTAALVAQLKSTDVQIQSAAAAALGDIGTPRAAQALKAFLPKAAGSLQQHVSDAILCCASRLLQDKRPAEAQALYSALVNSELPRHIIDAATLGLKRAI